MSIPISELVPTQDYIRNEKQIPGMVKHVEDGGIFDQAAIEAHLPNSVIRHSLMRIVQFDDGALFLSDGHHRVIGILEGGRDTLHRDEFFVERWSYQDYLDIVFTYPNGDWMGWITPHDPWQEIRLPELASYKFEVKRIWKNDGEEAAIEYIKGNKDKYCKKRTITSIQQLVDNYQEVSKTHGIYSDKYKALTEHQKENQTNPPRAFDQDRIDYSDPLILSGWSGLS